MTVSAAPEHAIALPQRLRAAAQVLLESVPAPGDDAYADAGVVLDLLVHSVHSRPDGGRLWLLLVALTGEFPLHEDVEWARRMLELTDPVHAQHLLLEQCSPPAGTVGQRTMQVVTDRPVVDVDFGARHELMTGVERVVRQTVPRWTQFASIELCGWTADGAALRELSATETRYVLGGESHPVLAKGLDDDGSTRVVVPWQVPVLLPAVPSIRHVPRLVALARHSGSTLRLIGYDCIPVVNAELVEPNDHAEFIAYLNVVKAADTVACVSDSAAEEFAGFVDMIKAQGIDGPRVTACALPNGAQLGAEDAVGVAVSSSTAEPAVVCVGRIDRRKNQITVLEAADRLWREGRQFQLRFFGSCAVAPPDFLAWADELTAEGRPLTIESALSDAQLGAAIRAARFSVFMSLHEGYGLPVAESLTLGVPVIAADVGSIREIAADDGAILVDPRSVDGVTVAMRNLLTDDHLLEQLQHQARNRPRRSWDDYAADVWQVLTSTGDVRARRAAVDDVSGDVSGQTA